MPRELTTEDRDYWDQQPEEPKLWYERFDVYRLIGPGRSIARSYRRWRLLVKGVETKSPNAEKNWYDMSKEWMWEDRANAWDDAIREDREEEAGHVFNEGLSLSHERIKALTKVAKRLEDFILDEKTTRLSPYIIEQYRGLLDDIAKERGERQKETRVTGTIGGAIMIETSWGRGGSANEAWKQVEAPASQSIVDAVVEEVENDG